MSHATTVPGPRRAAQQLKRARTVVRRQLAGVAMNGLASDMVDGGVVGWWGGVVGHEEPFYMYTGVYARTIKVIE